MKLRSVVRKLTCDGTDHSYIEGHLAYRYNRVLLLHAGLLAAKCKGYVPYPMVVVGYGTAERFHLLFESMFLALSGCLSVYLYSLFLFL